MPINAEWHRKNKMPKNASLDERLVWHAGHSKNCACRPTPKELLEEIKRKGIRGA